VRPSVLNLGYVLELDLENQCLWRGDDAVYLTRKAFAVLRILIEQRERLITKGEILRAAWPNARVEEGQVKQFIAQLRQLLHDDPEAPRFIETVHGRGYRFVGAIRLRSRAAMVPEVPDAPESSSLPHAQNDELIGRDRELGVLYQLFRDVSSGQRQTCLICGEPGIGKSALVKHFVAHVARSEPVWHLRAKCMRYYQPVEPYLAIGNALEDLLRTSGEAGLREQVQRYAPGWLQWVMPSRFGSDPNSPDAPSS
jgi:DNA-binding winged helix-turn-helix (wHTH) protein